MQRLAEIERRSADPGSIAALMFAQALYGDGVYSHSLLGTRDNLASIDRQELDAFYRRTIRTSGTTIVAVGGMDMDVLAARLDEALSGFANETAPTRPEISADKPEGVVITVVDRPGAQQTEMRIGHPGPPRNTEGREARILMNAILGGKFTSRINLNLREEHGFTYGASSTFVDRHGPGPFLVGAAIESDSAGQAVSETLGELRRIRDDLVETDELEDARSYVQGVFPYTMQTLQGLAARLEALIVHELALDYYDGTRERFQAVTREDVLEQARTHIDPDHLHVVLVGPAADLTPQLESLGEPKVSAPCT